MNCATILYSYGHQLEVSPRSDLSLSAPSPFSVASPTMSWWCSTHAPCHCQLCHIPTSWHFWWRTTMITTLADLSQYKKTCRSSGRCSWSRVTPLSTLSLIDLYRPGPTLQFLTHMNFFWRKKKITSYITSLSPRTWDHDLVTLHSAAPAPFDALAKFRENYW